MYGFFGYVFSRESLAFGMRILQLLGLAGAYGMSIWVTFISSYVLARALPRQQFAILQSKIYPVYFQAMAYSVGLVLVGHLLSRRKRVSSGAGDTLQGFNLLASLLMLLINLKYLEPLATKVCFDFFTRISDYFLVLILDLANFYFFFGVNKCMIIHFCGAVPSLKFSFCGLCF